MATGATLTTLLDRLRSELLMSPNPGHAINVVPAHKAILARVQRQLWEDYAWPHLRVRRDVAAEAGERYYDLPTDMPLDRVESVHVKWSGIWHCIERGIDAEHLSSFDSDLDIRADPIYRWLPYGTRQFEVWPVPASASTIRFEGIRTLGALVDMSDTCDLDEDLLTLFAAAELAADAKNPRSSALASAAQRHYAKLKGRLRDNSGGMFVLGGGPPPGRASLRRRIPQVAVDRGN